MLQIQIARLHAHAHVQRNVRGDARLTAQLPGGSSVVGQAEIPIMDILRSAADNYRVFGARDRRRQAIRIDRQLGRFWQQRGPNEWLDGLYGSGPDASPWKHGAVPLWLLQAFVTHAVDVRVSWSGPLRLDVC